MKTKVFIILLVILALSIGIYIYSAANKTYGNDIESIQNIISNEERIDGEIKLFDMVDMDGYRIVGYFEGDSNMGFALFKANKNGDYEFDYLYRGENRAISDDRIYVNMFTLYNDDESSQTMYDIFVSNNPNVVRVERIINGEHKDTLDITHNPSINLMKQPEIEINSATYYYYDSNGDSVIGNPSN